MAKSGALSTSNEYIKYTIEIIQNSQSVANNTSNVTVKVRFYRTNTGYETYGSGTVYCKINGTTYSASVTSSQKITSSGIELFTKTLNIPHNADGTKTLACSAWISHSRVTSSEQSYSATLTTIPRKSTLTVANGTLGTAQALTVTRQSTSFTHSIKVVCGSVTRYIKADGTLSTTEVKHSDCDISFTPPLEWASQNTTGQSVAITYTITTYNGSTNVGSNPYAKSCAIPASVKPSVSVATSEATGITISGYFSNVSKARFVITATPAYDSPIVSYKTTIDGKTYTAATFTTEALKSSGTVAYTTIVTDDRGRSTTYNGSISVSAYTMPSVKNLTVARCNSDGTANQKGEYAKVTFDFNSYNMPYINYVYIKTMYKKKTDAKYTLLEEKSYDYIKNGNGSESYIFAADTSSVYDVQIEITDTVCTSAGQTVPVAQTTLATISKFMQWVENVGLSIGKFFDMSKPKSLQVGWDAYFDKNVYIDGTPVRAKRCVCGQNGNSDENPWHKFASVTAKELNEDMRISFKITFAYGSVTRFGTLDVFVRTENASGANSFQNIVFESDTGLDTSNFVLAYSGTGVGATYELWVKLSSYRFCQFEVLSESSRMAFIDRWELYNSISLGEAAAPTEGYTQISAKRAHDCVIEQGTSGDWEYRKWDSGHYECWATFIGNSTNYSAAGFGYLHQLTFNYPITFAKRANPQVSIMFGSGCASVCSINSSYTNKVTLVFDANLSTGQYVVNLHVVGKWK